MSVFRPLVFAVLPLFSGCQMLDLFPAAAPVSEQRFQGQISQSNEQWLLSPCNDKTTYALISAPDSQLHEQATALLADSAAPLFADLRGTLEKAGSTQSPRPLRVTRLYRLQAEGPGCDDRNFRQLLVRAHGNEPSWNININNQGLVLERIGQPALALPYLEEQLPEGGSNISTAADGLNLELWLTPQSCTDSLSGAIEHLTAVLKLNGETLHGCAAYGALRDQ